MIPRGLTVTIALGGAFSAACLRRGEPPAGRQIIADRQAALGAIIPATNDRPLQVLILRPAPGMDAADLSAVSVDASGNVSPERPLVSGVIASDGLGCVWNVAPCSIDENGIVTVIKMQGGMVSVDPLTGQVQVPDTTPKWPPLTSPDGQRTFVTDSPTSGTLLDPGGQATPIQLVSTPYIYGPQPALFAGEDFYYLDPQNRLMVVHPSGVPEPVATDVADFRTWATPNGTVMILSRATADPAVQQLSVFDPSLGVETPLPADFSFVMGSPDGQWLVDTTHESEGRFIFFDYRSGAEEVADTHQYASNYQWRPGTSELWVTGVDADKSRTLWILTPGGSVSLPGVALSGVALGTRMATLFTPDGTYFFSTVSDTQTDTPVVQVGTADDPTGPRFDLNAAGTHLDRGWQLPDGRLLVAAFTKSNQRSDVIAVDPRTGESTVMAERGLIAAVGQTRFIGMFRFDEGRGDLTEVNLQTGTRTIFAPEFTVTAFAEAQGTDAVAPGARIVYQFQARTASPYDGIWLVNSR